MHSGQSPTASGQSRDFNRRPLPRRESDTGQLSLNPDKGWPVYDLIVIGGGINGTGIARDAAQRGLSVLLLEKSDFGAGTSAYSSRLIHGGLRYLANFEFDLVRESLRERELLLQNAPHLVKPLPMAIPVYRGGVNPIWKIEMGMVLYDMLSWGKRMPAHRLLGREQFLHEYPGVNANGLQGGPIYFDGQVPLPERICVENAIAAEETGRASLINHARVERFELSQHGIQSLEFRDLLTGETHAVQGRVTINASGPWVDELLSLMPGKRKQDHPIRRIGGTKGTHIVVKDFPGAPKTALYVEARADGRPFFIIPWRDGNVLVGTTDTHYQGSLDAVIPIQEEVAYLLAETNHVLPQAQLSEADVLYAYAGVRPLPFAEGKKAGKITRKHWIVDHAHEHAMPISGLISVIGGKLTTYRNLAEETVDYAVINYQLRVPKQERVPASNTKQTPLPGGEGIANWASYQSEQIPKLSRNFGLSTEEADALLSLYGSRVHQVLELLTENPDWKHPLSPNCGILAVQVVYAVRNEMAFTVEDVLLRRLGCGLDADLGFRVLEPIAHLMGELLDWPETRVQSEIRAYKETVTERHLVFKKGAFAPL